MADETYLSTQRDGETRKRPLDEHGKVRIAYFDVPAANVAAVGDAGSTFELCKLPTGAVRVLPTLSRVTFSAMGSARTLDIGHRAYQKRPPYVGSDGIEAEDLDALHANEDVSSAGNATLTGETFDFYSTGGVDIVAQINDGTIPIGATISGYILYVYE